MKSSPRSFWLNIIFIFSNHSGRSTSCLHTDPTKSSSRSLWLRWGKNFLRAIAPFWLITIFSPIFSNFRPSLQRYPENGSKIVKWLFSRIVVTKTRKLWLKAMETRSFTFSSQVASQKENFHQVQCPTPRPVRACHSSEGEEVQRLLQDCAPLWLGAQQDICRDGLRPGWWYFAIHF